MKQVVFVILIIHTLIANIFAVNNVSYTLSVCTVQNLENAFTCIDRSLMYCKKVYMIGDTNGSTRVNCNAYKTYKEAKLYEKEMPAEFLPNGPFVKQYDFDLTEFEILSNDKILVLDKSFQNKNNLEKQEIINKIHSNR